ncbi:hypothetical protein FS837_007250 [Tulasnella sp. UAMH 9824]|nr:hypothetical protein FS837_007250 [Tulasnella sp. UAMH 9824]
MARHRINPTRIKTTDPTTRGRGGQGVIIVGTLTYPGASEVFLSARLDELLHTVVIGGLIRGGSDEVPLEALKELLSEGPTELLTNAFEKLHSGGPRVLLRPEERKKVVLEAFKAFGRKVAVKKLEWPRNDVERSNKFFKSFVNEVGLMASLSHPNIIEFLGFVEDMEKGDAWIIVPWENNGNVREFLQSGEWDIPERISLIKDVAIGLDYLHSHDPPICHGDLKSLNILVNSSYRAVITDFGSARIRQSVSSEEEENREQMHCQEQISDEMGAESTSPKVKFDPSTFCLTLTGPAFSLRWTAPEVLNNGTQDLPSDMWAMGWICWEIITGKIPFHQLDRQEVIIKHALDGKLPAIREEAGLSMVHALCSAMSDCWLSEPDKRIGASTFERRVTWMVPSSTPSVSGPGGEKARSAELLFKIGGTYELQDDKTNAEAYYLSAIDIATRTHDQLAKVKALLCLGGIYTENSNLGKAESLYIQALEICFPLCDTLGTAHALASLGDVYRLQSKYREAEEAFKAARDSYSSIRNDLGAANALIGLGNAYQLQSRKQEAEIAFVEALEIGCRIGNELVVARAVVCLGNIYLMQSKDQEALTAFNEAYEIFSRIGNDRGAADALNDMGGVYRAQRNYGEAEKAFHSAYEIHSRTGNDLGAANALDGLGNTYRAQSRNLEAEKAFNAAQEIHSRVSDDIGSGNASVGLGDTSREWSTNQEAVAEGHERHSPVCDQFGFRDVFLRLGVPHEAQMRFREGRKDLLDAALNIRIDDDGGAGYGRALLGVAAAPGALSMMIEAIKSPSDHPSAAANGLHEVGQIYSNWSKIQVEKTLLDARAIHLINGNYFHAATASRYLGMLYQDQSRYNEAEKSYRQAIACYGRADDVDSSAMTLTELGELYRSQQRYLEAEEAVTEALAIWTSISNEVGPVYASTILAIILMSQSKYGEAMDILTQVEAESARMGMDGVRAMTAYWAGESQVAKCMYTEATESYRLSQAIFLSLGHSRGEAMVLNRLGGLYLRLYLLAEAEECFTQARPLCAAISDTDGELLALDGLIGVLGLQSRFGDTKRACMEACEIYERIGQPMSLLCRNGLELLREAQEL